MTDAGSTAEFASSDAARSGRPLRHAQSWRLPAPLPLTRGGELSPIEVAYETYGQLSPAADNAVLICHAISGDSHVARHSEDDDPGWWDLVVGPGKPIDTRKYFVICSNVLGGCRGTTGPGSVNPRTGVAYGPDFPTITVEDMVAVQRQLVAHLGIERLHAVIGGSMGGHQALAWAIGHAAAVERCVLLATAPRLTSQALAFDIVGRNAILCDPHFHAGHYYDQPHKPDIGLAIARMLGHITYLSPQSMAVKFDADRLKPREVATEFEARFSVGSYLAYQGHKFTDRFDANSYITLSTAMDLFDAGGNGGLESTLTGTTCRWLIMSFTSDWLFPPEQSREMVRTLIRLEKPVSYCNISSDGGHDAFLLPDDLDRYGEMIRATLAATGEPQDVPAATPPASPVSIFHRDRVDYDLIIDLIEPGSSVLDLGSERGELLARLARRGCRRLLGMELDERLVLQGLRRGLNIVQADLNRGLPLIADGQFDYVVLSQTLQSVIETESIIDEMLRVGRRTIVSFPNFAYYKIRRAMEAGRSPSSEAGLLRYAWYDTPNRRFLSIMDWRDYCAARGITIEREIFLDTEVGVHIDDDPNLNADLAICVIHR